MVVDFTSCHGVSSLYYSHISKVILLTSTDSVTNALFELEMCHQTTNICRCFWNQ